jgi:hypothetical protein
VRGIERKSGEQAVRERPFRRGFVGTDVHKS